MDIFPNTDNTNITVDRARFYDLSNRAQRIARCVEGDNFIAELRCIFSLMELAHDSIGDDFIDEMRVVGEECLWRAARAGSTGILEYLIRERGVDPGARRAMLYASRAGKIQAVQLLHSYGVPRRG